MSGPEILGSSGGVDFNLEPPNNPENSLSAPRHYPPSRLLDLKFASETMAVSFSIYCYVYASQWLTCRGSFRKSSTGKSFSFD